jgi:hypothetical protein
MRDAACLNESQFCSEYLSLSKKKNLNKRSTSKMRRRLEHKEATTGSGPTSVRRFTLTDLLQNEHLEPIEVLEGAPDIELVYMLGADTPRAVKVELNEQLNHLSRKENHEIDRELTRFRPKPLA